MAKKANNGGANQNITGRHIVRQQTSLEKMRDDEKALFIALDELNDEDFKRVKELVNSIDYDPLFLGHDSATCG